jgi:hypothetical protein
MVTVAGEMQRADLSLPLLIGGATPQVRRRSGSIPPTTGR